jgi:hypothetical protein
MYLVFIDMLNKVTSTMVTGSGSGEQVKDDTFVARVNQEVWWKHADVSCLCQKMQKMQKLTEHFPLLQKNVL